MFYRTLLVGVLMSFATPAFAHEEVVSKILDSYSTPDMSQYSAKERKDIACTALAVYHEAGNQPEKGQRAVANVIVNRTEKPEKFADTPCGVVFQKWHGKHQFSFFNRGNVLPTNKAQWQASVRAAIAVLENGMKPVKTALFFYNRKLTRSVHGTVVATIGPHVFTE